MYFEYQNPVKLIFGRGSFGRLDASVNETGAKNALIVTLPLFLPLAENTVKKSDLYRGIFTEIEPNPQLDDIKKLIKIIKEKDIDLLVALGGGSVIDGAKFAAALRYAEGDAEDFFYCKRAFPEKRIPLIALPTTAGTGSEVTQVAVVSRGKEKVTLNDRAFRPYAAIVDGAFTDGLPKRVTAVTGLDALSHALEGFWSKNHSPLTDIYSTESVRLIVNYFERVLDDPTDKDARDGMSYASLLAGLSFSVTKTAAVHACSYPLSEIYGLPHGEACALTLDAFVAINNDERLERLSRSVGFSSSAGLAAFVKKIKTGENLTTKLAGSIPKNLIEDCLKHPLTANNPVTITEEILKGVFHEIIQTTNR
jgi:alcohol dehydrogenase